MQRKTAPFLLSSAFLCLFSDVTGEVPTRPGRTLCQSARSQMEYLRPFVEETVGEEDPSFTLDVFSEVVLSREESSFFHRQFHEQDVPTKVLDMRLAEDLIERVISESKRKKEWEDRMMEIAALEGNSGYHLWSLQFENSVLFTPSCVEFFDLNRDLVQKEFPEVYTCHCNVFTPSTGARPYGLHHASSLGFQHPFFFKDKLFAPEKHMSFHATVLETDSTLGFTIFDGHTPEAFEIAFPARQVHLKGGKVLDETEIHLVRASLLALPQVQRYIPVDKVSVIAPQTQVRALMDFVVAAYWATEACGDPKYARGGQGTIWETKPGQALILNNWRAHGDNPEVPPEVKEKDGLRVSIDLRCFSKMKLPRGAKTEADVTNALLAFNELEWDRDARCLLKLLGYVDETEFFDTVFGPGKWNKKLTVRYTIGSLWLNFINGGKNSLMHSWQVEGMRRHFKRMEELANGPGLDFEAFRTCISEEDREPYEEGGSGNDGGRRAQKAEEL